MRKIDIEIDDEFRSRVAGFKVVVLQANIVNGATTDQVKQLLIEAAETIRRKYTLPEINTRPGIAATRAAYKLCGKDPNRYRPSQEQLCRRIVAGKELYYVSNVVDLFNAISLLSGYSIGAFDADKIQGDTLTLGVGRPGEPYEGIGRGELNIEDMPVYRDKVGGVGTPTSDNERTKTDDGTTSLLVCVNIYAEEMPADEVIELSVSLLKSCCSASDITARIVEE